MASLHRKLLPHEPNTTYTPTTTTTTVQTCLYFCNSQKNETTGFCPPACLALCPSICHYSLAALISPPHPLPQPNKPQVPHKNLSPLLISMLIILASAFLLFTFYVLYTKLYFHFYNPYPQTRPSRSRTRDDHLGQDHASTVVFHPAWYITTVGLNPSLINAIAVIKYAKEENSCAVECTDCAVCLAEFEDEEELRILPKCNHAFHVPCIDTWLKSHINCPLCRAPVVAPDHLDQTVQSSSPPSAAAAGEVRISVGETEENMGNSGSANCVENKELRGINYENNINNKGCGSSSSSSLERGAANLVSSLKQKEVEQSINANAVVYKTLERERS
ncbi:hypothetical protein Cgig2_019442 [Carnegiea gigantea]|uniref:RING-type E3 ubiquitin transferase n=1 Tax=Carnegiea gigantea TaxID=171969 RepID=A0A9Q1QLV4_9CARY|nr:hypothetical protein Cgig2_019442 [Carnegiea gigantea]